MLAKLDEFSENLRKVFWIRFQMAEPKANPRCVSETFNRGRESFSKGFQQLDQVNCVDCVFMNDIGEYGDTHISSAVFC